MLHSKTKSKDIKLQKLQTGILKAVAVISKALYSLRKLKNTKNLNNIHFKGSLSSIVYDCMGLITWV